MVFLLLVFLKTAENIGFTSYPPAYLSKEAEGSNLLIGANFASGASGYYETTAKLYVRPNENQNLSFFYSFCVYSFLICFEFWCYIQHAIPLSQQVEYFKEYQAKLEAIAGKSNASSIISGGIVLLSSGSSDFVQNYYINPLLYKVYTPDQFSDMLIQSYEIFVQVCVSPII